jgi:acyl-CoA dehydrogenase
VDFSFDSDQQAIRDAVLALCAQFPGDYWLERDADGQFPVQFQQAMAEAGGWGSRCPRR